MKNGVRKLAIIRRPKFGMTDQGYVGLTFQAYTSECTVAQQFLNTDQTVALIKEMRLTSITELEGKPCWVLEEGEGGAGMLCVYDGPFVQ